MACVDAECAGETAVSDVSDITVKLFAASEPNATAVAPVNPVPVTVTVVFPVVGPEVGEIPVTVGTGVADAGAASTAIGMTTTDTIRPRKSPLTTGTPWATREAPRGRHRKL